MIEDKKQQENREMASSRQKDWSSFQPYQKTGNQSVLGCEAKKTPAHISDDWMCYIPTICFVWCEAILISKKKKDTNTWSCSRCLIRISESHIPGANISSNRKLNPSFVAEITIVSPMACKSRQVIWNSTDGIWTTHLCSVSGIPNWSASISINFNETCDTRSPSIIIHRIRFIHNHSL